MIDSDKFSIQSRVLHALILREMGSRFGRSRLGYVWGLVNPSLAILVLFLVFTLAGRLVPAGVPLLMFTVTGFLTWHFFSNSMTRAQGALEGNQSLLMYPQVTTLDVILSRAVLEFLTYTVVLIILSSVAMLVEGSHFPHVPHIALFAFWLAGILGTIVGVVISSLKPLFNSIDNIVSPIIRLGFFISGVLFAGSDVPAWILPYLDWNPMFHLIEMMRDAWFSTYVSPVGDMPYVLTIVFLGLWVALAAERVSRRYQFQ